MKKIIIGFLVIIILITSFYSYQKTTEVNSLATELSDLQEQINVLQNDNKQLNNNLNTKISELQDTSNALSSKETQLTSMSKDLEDTQTSLKETETKIENTKQTLDEFNNQIINSLNWFKDNVNIKDIDEYNEVKKYIRSRCITENSNSCDIRVGCFPYINDQIHGFKYKDDKITSGTEDKLQNLTEFAIHKGGDCEDYSILFNAELNYAKDYCKELGIDKFNIEAVQPNEGTRYWLYTTNSGIEWFYPNSIKFEIPNDYVYHYVVCGGFPSEYDPNSETTGKISGHCATAFTNKEITNSNDIVSSLTDMIIIEPQSGFLTFDNRFESPMKVSQKTNERVDFTKQISISMVITQDDFYNFGWDGKESQWKGYNDFKLAGELLADKFY